MNEKFTLWHISISWSLLKKLTGLTMLALLFPLFAISQTIYTFTNAGAIGVAGPSQAQVNTAYSATTLAGNVTVIGQGIQEWVVPTTGAYSIVAAGASGGYTPSALGGKGLQITTNVNLTAGNVIRILVGQEGGRGEFSIGYMGGGGGGTFVINQTTGNPILISGGGGGAGQGNGSSYPYNLPGVNASAYNVTSGGDGTASADSWSANGVGGTGGNGGGAADGGSGGGGYTGNGTMGTYGGNIGNSFASGGLGGTNLTTGGAFTINVPGGFGGGAGGGMNTGYEANGGGGGGYSGGGGSNSRVGSGGGGGNYYTGTYVSSALNTGNGKVIITNLYSATISQTSNILCNGASTGALSVTVNGSVGPYTYSWSPNVSSSSTATNLAAGTYTVTVTSSTSATTTASYTITQPTALTATTSQTNVSCNGGANGTATVSVSGGTASYAYSWAPSGGTAATATGRTAGAYTCTITDANGCTLTKSFTITQPSAINATTSQVNVSCNGGANGTATVVASGGTGAYTYSWSPSGGTAATTTGRTAGAYTCTITDANSCTLTKSFTITQPSALVASVASQTNVSCNAGSNGAASVSVSGGTAAYTYNWTPGNPTGDGTASVTGLTAGTWTCTVTDANTCTTAQSFTVTQPAALSLTAASQTNVSCFGGTNGAASVNVAIGGTGTKTYNWTPGNPTGDGTVSVTGLPAGTWICTVTDANGCVTTQAFTVTQPSGLVLTAASQTNIACNGGSTGAASVNAATGGTGAKTYNWTPGNPTGDGTISVTGLTAGTWTCTATDANGCTTSQSFTLSQPTALAATTSQTNVSCNGGSNGTATVVVSGGVASYSYAWSPSGGTAATTTGRTAGIYTCTITDANGCTLIKSFTITQPSVLAASSSQTNVSCNGGSNGTATVSASGGSPSYSYSWSPSGGTGATASGLAAGTYTCTITDANTCETTKSVIVTQPAAFVSGSKVVTNVSCFGGLNGSINLTPSGGTPGYTFNWGGGITTEDRTGLTAGSYSVQITDANGCTGSVNATVTQPAAAVSGSTVVTNVACNGGTNGAINLTPTGGSGGYTFNWLPSGPTTEDRTGLTAGSYSVQITDANGCTGTVNATVTQPSAIVATTSLTNVSCNGGSNGSASVVVSGGVSTYTYAWSPSGGTAATASGLSAGAFTCTITDANGCTLTKSFTITQPTALAATTSQTNVSCNGGSNGSASVVVSGGVSTYTYAWSPSGGTAATASGLSAGAFTCTITDANGCTLSKSFTITQPTALAASTSQVNVICIGGNNGSASVVASGGTAAYSYAWSPGGGTAATASSLTAGNYTCTISDANMCSITKSFSIIQSDLVHPVVVIKNVTLELNSTGNASMVSSDIDNGSYDNCSIASMSASKTDFTCANLGANNVTLTVTDASGNSSTDVAVVTIKDKLSPVANVLSLPDVTGECSASAIAPTATDNCSGGVTATATVPLTYSVQGSYVIQWTYSDGNGNSSTQDQNVIVKDVTAPVADVTVLADVTGECSATAIAPTATDNCTGVITATTADPLFYESQGSYIIHWTYIDGNGNSSTQDQNVIVKDVTAPVTDVAVLAEVTGECSATAIAPTATDNCTGVITATTADPLTYDAQGSYSIHWTYSDGNGNSSTQDQNVIVKDVTAPVADVAVLADVTGECSATAIAPTATDNCTGVLTATTADPLTYDAQGSYSIHWTYSDGNGNSSTQDQNVIVKDVTSPVADVAVLVDVTGECSATAITPTATDNCTGVLTATTADPLTYDAQGSYIIHWTYSDGNGNSSTQDQNVIVADETDPSFACTNDTTVVAQVSVGHYTIVGSTFDPESVADNCGIATLQNNVTNTSTLDGATLALGANVVTWTATDEAGNTFTCNTTITVLLNVEIPEFKLRNVSVYPNPSNGMFTLEVPTSCTSVIYDARGRVIKTEKLVDNLNKIDLTKCQQGVYLLKLIKDEQVVNVKLIVE